MRARPQGKKPKRMFNTLEPFDTEVVYRDRPCCHHAKGQAAGTQLLTELKIKPARSNDRLDNSRYLMVVQKDSTYVAIEFERSHG